MSDKNINDQDFDNQDTEISDSSYDETYEDDVTYTEDDSDEWSDDVDLSDEEAVEDEEAPPKKKKSSALTIAIILVVAVIGVFGFMILTGGSGETPQAEVAADAENGQLNISDLKQEAEQTAQGDQTVNFKPSVPPAAPVAPQQGLMEDPTLLSENNNADVAPPVAVDDQPSALTAPVDMSAVPDLTAPVPPFQDVVNTISPTVKPVSDFPTVDSIKKSDAGSSEEAAPAPVMTATPEDVLSVPPAPAQIQAAPIAPAVIPAQEDKSLALQAKIDDATKKITLLEKQLSDKSAELDAQKKESAKALQEVASVSASGAEIDALKNKIADLEERLAEKAEKVAKPIMAERKVIPEARYTVDEPKVKKVIASQPKAVATQSWSLKSASTGKAILSDKATGDLKTVRVGDVVAGLGRIVSISDKNSAWVVQGTAGSVSE